MSWLRMCNTFLVRQQPIASCIRCNPWILPYPPLNVKIQRLYSSAPTSVPRAIQPSIWQSVIPKALRQREKDQPYVAIGKRKEWNPATFFILISLLIGSNAIQMIALKNDFLNFSRKADAKIGLLKEVIEKVQRGEHVDVEGLLGTGDKEKEREWEDGTAPCSIDV